VRPAHNFLGVELDSLVRFGAHWIRFDRVRVYHEPMAAGTSDSIQRSAELGVVPANIQRTPGVEDTDPTRQFTQVVVWTANALGARARNATFSLGFGISAMAGTVMLIGPTIPALLLGAGAFQIFARIGHLVDRRFEQLLERRREPRIKPSAGQPPA
jgi:hypothetical protein